MEPDAYRKSEEDLNAEYLKPTGKASYNVLYNLNKQTHGDMLGT